MRCADVAAERLEEYDDRVGDERKLRHEFDLPLDERDLVDAVKRLQGRDDHLPPVDAAAIPLVQVVGLELQHAHEHGGRGDLRPDGGPRREREQPHGAALGRAAHPDIVEDALRVAVSDKLHVVHLDREVEQVVAAVLGGAERRLWRGGRQQQLAR
eukprot:5543057-Prymnesium_polylepis.1